MAIKFKFEFNFNSKKGLRILGYDKFVGRIQ